MGVQEAAVEAYRLHSSVASFGSSPGGTICRVSSAGFECVLSRPDRRREQVSVSFCPR